MRIFAGNADMIVGFQFVGWSSSVVRRPASCTKTKPKKLPVAMPEAIRKYCGQKSLACSKLIKTAGMMVNTPTVKARSTPCSALKSGIRQPISAKMATPMVINPICMAQYGQIRSPLAQSNMVIIMTIAT